MDPRTEEVKRGFEGEFGFSPDGIWSAPGRVNLIGEHTDYNNGFVFPFAIDRRTYVAAAERDDGLVNVYTTFGAGSSMTIELADLAPDDLEGWSAYPLGVLWAMGRYGAKLDVLPGLDIYIDSDVPVGSGLSSSAAIECAVALAANDLWKMNFDRKALAQAGQLAENVVVGAPTGIMDQTASLFGSEGDGVFLDCKTLASENIHIGLEEAGLVILVIDTKNSHAHATGGFKARRDSCELAARTLGVESLRDLSYRSLCERQGRLDSETFKRACHVVTENDRVVEAVKLMRDGRVAEIGPYLNASHISMRDYFEISTPQIDTAVETAVANGALGARLTGGGFGGSAIALVKAEDRDDIERQIVNAFEQNEFGKPDFFTVLPSRAACVEVRFDLARDVAF